MAPAGLPCVSPCPPALLLALSSLFLACTDPALAPLRDAATAWDAGRAALVAGDNAAAIADFGRARALDPQSAALPLWQGKAYAAAGRLDEAVAAASDSVVLDPRSGIAEYDRAAWVARGGHLDDAALALKAALDAHAATRWSAAKDPDFSPHRSDPAFIGVLPPSDVLAGATGPTEAVFLGSEVAVDIDVMSATGDVVTLVGPDVPACLKPVRLVEDDDDGEPGTADRVLHVWFSARSACDALLGPWEAHSGGAVVAIPAVHVTVYAPAEAVSSTDPPRPGPWVLPGTLPAESLVPGWPGAVARMGARAPDPAVLLEWRVDHQTRAIGGIYVKPVPP